MQKMSWQDWDRKIQEEDISWQNQHTHTHNGGTETEKFTGRNQEWAVREWMQLKHVESSRRDKNDTKRRNEVGKRRGRRNVDWVTGLRVFMVLDCYVRVQLWRTRKKNKKKKTSSVWK